MKYRDLFLLSLVITVDRHDCKLCAHLPSAIGLRLHRTRTAGRHARLAGMSEEIRCDRMSGAVDGLCSRCGHIHALSSQVTLKSGRVESNRCKKMCIISDFDVLDVSIVFLSSFVISCLKTSVCIVIVLL